MRGKVKTVTKAMHVNFVLEKWVVYTYIKTSFKNKSFFSTQNFSIVFFFPFLIP
jgi:hypothetical protein